MSLKSRDHLWLDGLFLHSDMMRTKHLSYYPLYHTNAAIMRSGSCAGSLSASTKSQILEYEDSSVAVLQKRAIHHTSREHT